MSRRRARGRRRAPAAMLAAATLLALVACGHAVEQSALHPAGPQARKVSDLWWFALIVSTVVYVVTIGALLWAAWRARRREHAGAPLPPDSERRMTRAVAAGVGATVALLLVFFVYDLSVGRTLSPPPGGDPLTINVIGHQWWWEVQYPDTTPHGRFTTANEIHVPVGRPVVLLLTSTDVIHSIWVPNLAGKKDLIPGYTQSVWFQADTAGVYRGQCAEFCGHQHAKMALVVVAEPPAEFQRWLAQSRQPALPPTDSVTRRGQEVFLTGPCVMCHAIDGTPAGSNVGPNLTHLASRRTLGAGTLPNTRGHLAGWIVDPQRVKPGVWMPPNQLAPRDLEALLTYLQSLK
ncbi:MAG TPA: cytochrome c oxidase subunit II [Gemmatimonadaceae bacterium]|nr:cytochrome c oxidase subunit II [Gemmatimonadaceae bacterium]